MGAWKSCLSALFPSFHLPEAWRKVALTDCKLLALDLELTSLDVRTSEVTSIGWIAAQGYCIRLASAHYQVINTQADLSQSPVIHGLTQQELAQGNDLAPELTALAKYAGDYLWILHNSQLDMQVIKSQAGKLGIALPPILTLDTLRLEQYVFNKRQKIPKQDAFTLAACRRRYKLADAPAHQALDDAQATLELCLAQLSELHTVLIKDLIHTQALQIY